MVHRITTTSECITEVLLHGKERCVWTDAYLDELLEHHTDLLAAIETWERPGDFVVIPDDTDLDQFGLSGFASDALTEMRVMAEQGDQAPVAIDALALLYRLVGSRP